MSLLPHDAGYLEQVQAYFLAFRGDGVALSPLDANVLAEWESRGIPYPVVCRGIRKAAEAIHYGERPGTRLRTLRSCRLAVEREYQRWEGLQVGERRKAGGVPETPEDYAAQRLRKARALLRKTLEKPASPAHARAARAAMASLEKEAVTEPRHVARLIARAEEVLALSYVRALPPSARREMVKKSRALAGPRPAHGSPRARKDALRAHLLALARARGKLVAFA